VGAALIVLFNYKNFEGALKVAIAAAAAFPMAYIGVRCWSRGLLRTAIAFLLAFCFLWPIVLLVAMGEYGLLSSQPDPMLEFFPVIFGDYFREITNAQLLWGFLLSLPASLWLRRFTRSSVFSLVTSVFVALICGVLLLQSGLLQWEWSNVYLHLIPVALLFFVIGMSVERFHYPADSVYFYPLAVGFTWIALTGLAATHQGYMEFVDRWWHVGDQREYLFLVNACVYFLLQGLCELVPLKELQMTSRAFRFVIPLHVLAPLYFLGDSAMDHWKGKTLDPSYKFEARFFEILLPCASCALAFLSIPRQMKNFFAWGMIFLAVGIVQLQHDIFEDRRSWLIGLVLGGLR